MLLFFLRQMGCNAKWIVSPLAVGFAFSMASLVTAADIINTASGTANNLEVPVNSNQTVANVVRPRLELIKSGDRAAAEPGDTIIYRLTLKNTGEITANNILITDILPLGINYVSTLTQASLTTGTSTTPTSLTGAVRSGQNVSFNFPTLAPGEALNVVYGAVITPDAVRGSGRNIAQESRSNTATHLVRIRPGILSDCGTIIGRVFIDKNGDGEQQPEEKGMPNAVIFMDDGNRITTDEKGLFSLGGVISGDRTGVLDLTSVPGYEIAENTRFIERNSQSRLVRVAPGSMVRMNFAITPLPEDTPPSPSSSPDSSDQPDQSNQSNQSNQPNLPNPSSSPSGLPRE